MDGQKDQVDKKKLVGGMMMLVMVLVRSRNYRKSENRETQVSRDTLKQGKKLGGLFTRPNVKLKRNDLEMLYVG